MSSQRVARTALLACGAAILLGLGGSAIAQVVPDPGERGPYQVAHFTTTVTNPATGQSRTTDIYYPTAGNGVDPAGAPYPTLVFAAGFLAVSSNYSGNGEHLASWGYIVAIPSFLLDAADVRASEVQAVLTYLEVETRRSGSPLEGMIDTARFGVAGHSLGGAATLMLLARDSRIQAAVALDPTANPFAGWDYATELPLAGAPLLVVGAPSQTCNNSASYDDTYAAVGSEHKVKLVLAGGSHCDFMDTADTTSRSGCYMLCGGQFSTARLQLVERYTVAWFNYYLKGEAGDYTYVFGANAAQDVQAGRISREMQTAPRGVTAAGQGSAVRLAWDLSSYRAVAGYNIYRSQQSGSFPGTPYAQVGRVASFLDASVVPGQRYYYVVRSRDAAGNEHQPSLQVSAQAPGVITPRAYLPTILHNH